MEQTTLRPKPMPGRGTGGGSGESPGQSLCRDPEDHPDESGRPHTAGRRGKRLAAVVSGVLLAVLLVLSGVGIGTVGATVIGMSALAEMRQSAPPPGAAQPPAHAGPPAQHPDTPQPGAPQPGAPRQDAPRPGTAKPSAARPGTAKPGAVKPGTAALAAPGATPPMPGPARPAGAATLGIEAVDAPGASAGALIVGLHLPGPGQAAGLVRGDTLLTFDRTRVGSAADLAAAVAATRPGKKVTLTVRHKNGTRQTLPVRPGVVT
ncbi:PDZ domain-containing protein [Streptomyces huasconensis]|uniref:PDZ domain-containing protein n=1 Tax=Streptomyces huasconensis TaxID=1854574 RepID=A0ABV3M3D7_9ACTN